MRTGLSFVLLENQKIFWRIEADLKNDFQDASTMHANISCAIPYAKSNEMMLAISE